MKTRHALMALALAGAGGLLIFADKPAGDDVAEPVARRPTLHAAGVATPASVAAAVSIVALRPRAELVGEDDDRSAASALFQSQNWAAPPPSASAAAQTAVAPPPQAPPLPFTYIGKAVGDGIWEVFLVRADKTYIVREQTVIDGQYRVERIAPPTITLTYLPLKQSQQINIGALD